MSGNTEKCDDADWKTPRPSCTCGVGDDAPWSAHMSRRFPRFDINMRDLKSQPDFSRDCALYTWHKGCHGRTPDDKPNATRVRACPHQGCKVKFCVCDNHGGDAEAIRRMVRHLEIDHFVCGYPGCPGRGIADLHIHVGEARLVAAGPRRAEHVNTNIKDKGEPT